MLERKEGYLVSTASAAGLLTQLGAIGYAVTKHAAVAVAEYISVTYHDQGIRASCLCPQFVNTPMVNDHLDKDKLRQIAERARDERIRYQADVSFDSLPFPNVEEWDLLKARDPLAGAALVQVKQATIPLWEGSQTIGAIRRVSRLKRHGNLAASHGGL
jgi:NAD(P)-dependent dehydrogenase (short-subunit alcohol dehydrogenase family)